MGKNFYNSTVAMQKEIDKKQYSVDILKQEIEADKMIKKKI